MKEKKIDPFKNLVLDKYEQELEDAFGRGEFVSVGNIQERRKELAQAARNTNTERKRINIRMRKQDLEEIKQKARKHGLPYQTLISTILHQYAKGKITLTL